MVVDVFSIVQLFNGFVVGVFGELGEFKDVLPIYCEWILEAVEVPIVEQSEVKAHVSACEPFITTNEREEGV
jgi:hypothetical protein